MDVGKVTNRYNFKDLNHLVLAAPLGTSSNPENALQTGREKESASTFGVMPNAKKKLTGILDLLSYSHIYIYIYLCIHMLGAAEAV